MHEQGCSPGTGVSMRDLSRDKVDQAADVLLGSAMDLIVAGAPDRGGLSPSAVTRSRIARPAALHPVTYFFFDCLPCGQTT